MRLSITCDGSPISVRLDSISITRELSGRKSRADFEVYVNPIEGVYDESLYGVATYAPDDAQPIPAQRSVIRIADESDNSLFGGYVVNVAKDQKNYATQVWKVTCSGWEGLLENQVYTGSFTTATDRDIIQTIFGAKLPEITTDDSTVDELAVAISVDFKDATLGKVLQQLADLSGAEYYVSADKELIWRAAGSVAAPIQFSNAPDAGTSPPTYVWRNFQPERSSVQFANRVTVLGLDAEGNELTSTASNSTSIADIGVQEKVIPLRDIDNQAVLDLAAAVYLEKFAVQEYITFQCDQSGLEVGQLLDITSVPAGIDGSFQIQTVKHRQISPDNTVYEVSVGDYRGSIDQRLRALDRIKNSPKIPNPAPPANSVGTSQLKDDAVTALKLAADAVTSASLAVGAVTESIIAAGAVTETKIGNDAVKSPAIYAGAVTSAKLASGSVIAGKIAAGVITGVEIQAGSITAAHAVFAAGAIQNADIANATITGAKIANATITDAKITTLSASKLTAGTIDASTITVANIDASQITSGFLNTSVLATASISGLKLTDGSVGDIKISSGLSASKITTGTLDASVVNVTNLNASHITSGSLSADRITSGTLDCSSITVSNLSASSITSGTISGAITVTGGLASLSVANFYLGANIISGPLQSGGESGLTGTYTLASITSMRFSRGLLVAVT